jgi:tetratricopeptide (TPR) repeat protein
MSVVELHNVDQAVNRLRDEVLRGRSTRDTWSVTGEPTAGKTAVLHELRNALRSEPGVRPILVTPPAREYDAGPVALIQLTEALTDNEAKLAEIKDPQRPWDDKLRRVRAWVQRDPARTVLLVDEPRTWLPRDTYFRTFVRDIWDIAFDGLGTATVAAGLPPFRVSSLHRVELAPASDPQRVLDAIDAASLAEARRLVLNRFGDRLVNVSPLQVRLLVAIAALDPSAIARTDPSVAESRAELVGALLELVDLRGDAAPLRDVWLRLAEVREPFEDDLLPRIGARELGDVATAILRQCLLFERDGRLILHETLRRIPLRTERFPPDSHERLAAYYRDKFIERGGDAGGRLRDAVEAFHHASSAGIVALDEYRPFFVDQLNILGYHLSYDQQDYGRAAEIFEVALRWDAENAYAAHYRAFNLDQLAERPDEVEALYRQAIELAPWHIWFRSRLISFLIARARIDDAWSAWLEAIDELDGDYGDYFYFSLHLHVARMLVYRGEVDLAEAVLRGIPAPVRRDARFVAIDDRIEILREARDRGSYVPAPFLRKEWWRYGPNLLRDHEGSRSLRRWLAARVVSVDEEGLALDAADIVNAAPPEFGPISVPSAVFSRWWRGPGDAQELESGTFIEVGFYGESADSTVVALPYPQLRWPDLVHPDEDPDRYLRRRAA